MLSEIKTVEVLDALRYCNKYMIGIDNDRVKHFYKIKHGMLAHLKVYQSDERTISCGDPHLETIEDHKGNKIQVVNIW